MANRLPRRERPVAELELAPPAPPISALARQEHIQDAHTLRENIICSKTLRKKST